MWTFLPNFISDKVFTFILNALPWLVLAGLIFLIGMAIISWKFDKTPLLALIVGVGLLWMGYNSLDAYICKIADWDTYRGGLCESLREDVFTMVLFLEDDDSSWSAEEQEDFLKTIDSGMAFIAEQGDRYGHTLLMDYGFYDNNNDDVPDKVYFPFGVPKKDEVSYSLYDNLLEQSAKYLGYSSVGEMVREHQEYSKEKQIAYLLCVNKSSDCYEYEDNIGTTFGDYELARRLSAVFYDEVEYAVVFTKDGEKSATKSGMIAHEILTLFGAEPMYEDDGLFKQREKLAKKWCPKDVMRTPDKSVKRLDIGDYTAYTIGWKDFYPEKYDNIGWYE